MATIQFGDDEPLVKLGMLPVAVLFASPECVIGIGWLERCSPKDRRHIEHQLEHGVAFGDYKDILEETP